MTEIQELKDLALGQKQKITDLQSSVDKLQEKQDKAFKWLKDKIDNTDAGATKEELQEVKAILEENDTAIDAATTDVNSTVVPDVPETTQPLPEG